MKSVCACALLVGVSTLAQARPVVIEDNGNAHQFRPRTQFGRQVATNGEDALVPGSRHDPPDKVEGEVLRHRDALLYRRVGDQWQFQQFDDYLAYQP